MGFIGFVSILFFSFVAHAQPLTHVKFTAVDSFGSPLRARIFVDGKRVGDTPEKVALTPGMNSVLLTHEGYKDLNFTVEALEGENKEISKQMTPTEKKEWSFALGLGLSNSTVRKVKEDRPDEGKQYSCCFLIHTSFQRMLGRYLALRINYNFISNTSTTEAVDKDDIIKGPANSSQTLLTDNSGHQFGGALPVYLYRADGRGFYLGPEAGVLRSKLVFKRITYDNLGIGVVDRGAREDTISQNYYGIVTGYEWIKQNDEPHAVGLFILGGYRLYEDAKSEVESKVASDEPQVFKGDSVFYIAGGVLLGF